MQGDNLFIVGEWTVDPDLDLISRGEEQKTLRPQVMKLLVYLASRDGQLCQFEDLFKDLWPNKVVSDTTLYNCVAELRHQLDIDADSPSAVQTIPKKGYRLVGDIHLVNGVVDAAANSDQLPVRQRLVGIRIGLGVIFGVAVAYAISDYLEVTRPSVSAYKKLSTSQVILPPVSSPVAITADDSRLYFSQFLDGELTPSQLAQSGGEAMPLTLATYDKDSIASINGMTPDKSNFLIEYYPGVKTGTWSPELWLAPKVGGSARRLGKGRQGVFSPSGDQLLYMKDSTNMFIANADMTESRKLATLPHRIYWPKFSPDGSRVRFTQDLDQFAHTLWEIKLDGSEPYRLLKDWRVNSACCGSWTPDGKYYIFQARIDTDTQLWAIENAKDGGIDTAEPFQITSGQIDFLRPTISSDGDTIFAVGWQLRGETLEYDSAAGAFKPVPGLESMSVEQLAYSRDAQMVAYVAYPDGTLWVKQLEKGTSLQLTYAPLQVAEPVFSPDGSKIAFTGWVPGESYKVYVVATTGGDPSLISESDGFAWSPSWSSDGKKLLFSDRDRDRERLRVYDFTLDTTTYLPGTDGVRSPVWSPDGKSIVAKSGRDLVLYDVESETLTVILEKVMYHYTYWSSDSKALYLVDSFIVGRERSVYRFNIEDQSLSKIAEVGRVRNTWGTAGQWIGVKSDGTPLLLRDQSIHNIYALDWDQT